MRPAAALASLVLSASLMACGGGSSTGTQRAPGHPLYDIQATRGRSGPSEELRIDSDGGVALTASPGPSGQGPATHDRLRHPAIERIGRVLGRVPLNSLPPRPPTGCRDCFGYRVSYGGATYRTDESVEPRRLRSLIRVVGRIAGNAGSSHASARGSAIAGGGE